MDTGGIPFIAPTLYQRGVGVVLGLLLIVITVRLLQRFHIREELALPWLGGAVLLILVSVFVPLLRLFTTLIGAGLPSTTLFIGSIFFLIVQSLYLTCVVSRQKRQIQELTIQIALQRAGADEQAAANPAREAPPA